MALGAVCSAVACDQHVIIQWLWRVLQLGCVSCCYAHRYKYHFCFLCSEVGGGVLLRVRHSLLFVHDAEGEREARGDFLEVVVRNEAVLVVVVVLEHGL